MEYDGVLCNNLGDVCGVLRNPGGVLGRLVGDHQLFHKLGSDPTRSHVELDGKTKKSRHGVWQTQALAG